MVFRKRNGTERGGRWVDKSRLIITAWPDWAKIRYFGYLLLQSLATFLEIILNRTKFELTLAIFKSQLGKFCIVVNGQMMKKTLTIRSHWPQVITTIEGKRFAKTVAFWRQRMRERKASHRVVFLWLLLLPSMGLMCTRISLWHKRGLHYKTTQRHIDTYGCYWLNEQSILSILV